jgi:hypothetical protein
VPRKRKPKKQLTVQLKDLVGTERAKVMECLEQDGLGKEAAVWQLVLAWYLPFTLEAGDLSLRSAAIQCVGVLEGRIAAILKYAGLSPLSATVAPNMALLPTVAFSENGKPSNAIPDGDSTGELEEDDEDQELLSRQQQRLKLDRLLLGD